MHVTKIVVGALGPGSWCIATAIIMFYITFILLTVVCLCINVIASRYMFLLIMEKKNDKQFTSFLLVVDCLS